LRFGSGNEINVIAAEDVSNKHNGVPPRIGNSGRGKP
jgi:hypothetical protein